MAHGASAYFGGSIASAATLSGEIDLGRAWSRLYIDTAGLASEVRFQMAKASGGTYRQVLLPQPTTSTVQANIWKVSSGASGSFIEGPAGFQYLKVETTAAVTNGATFVVYVSDQ